MLDYVLFFKTPGTLTWKASGNVSNPSASGRKFPAPT